MAGYEPGDYVGSICFCTSVSTSNLGLELPGMEILDVNCLVLEKRRV